jgi:hypothetical protein
VRGRAGDCEIVLRDLRVKLELEAGQGKCRGTAEARLDPELLRETLTSALEDYRRLEMPRLTLDRGDFVPGTARVRATFELSPEAERVTLDLDPGDTRAPLTGVEFTATLCPEVSQVTGLDLRTGRGRLKAVCRVELPADSRVGDVAGVAVYLSPQTLRACVEGDLEAGDGAGWNFTPRSWADESAQQAHLFAKIRHVDLHTNTRLTDDSVPIILGNVIKDLHVGDLANPLKPFADDQIGQLLEIRFCDGR